MKICLMLFKKCPDAKLRPLFPWPYDTYVTVVWVGNYVICKQKNKMAAK